MKNLKRFAVSLTLVLIVACFVPMLSGCFEKPEYQQFKIQYTQNLEFNVGEDYYDANLRGVAIKLDGTEEDVTDRMEVDTSEYNKEVPGTYRIYCRFEKHVLSYTVTVVE